MKLFHRKMEPWEVVEQKVADPVPIFNEDERSGKWPICSLLNSHDLCRRRSSRMASSALSPAADGKQE